MRSTKQSKGEKREIRMSDKVTPEQLQEALVEWNEKFRIIRKKFSGASIEECITILKAVEEAAKEKKEDEKPSMGFGSKGTKV